MKRAGIDPQSAEDVASEIMLRFMERDFLHEFDPTLTFLYKGELRPARFKSFLSKFVLIYVRGHKDKQKRLMEREWLLLDKPAREDEENLWLDTHYTVPSAEDDVLAMVSAECVVSELRAYLSTIPRRSRYDTLDLVALFDEVVRQLATTDAEKRLDFNALRRHFNVSSTAIHSWMWTLKTHLAAALGRPVPAKRVRAAPAPRAAT